MSAAGVRSTRQRAAISTLLETLDDFRSAQELHDELRRRGENIGLTTVYRTLQSMASSGLVDTLRTDTGESVYRRCSEHHHHHLVCRSCGSTIEVGDHEVEAWAAEVATKHGFSDVSHTIEVERPHTPNVQPWRLRPACRRHQGTFGAQRAHS